MVGVDHDCVTQGSEHIFRPGCCVLGTLAEGCRRKPKARMDAGAGAKINMIFSVPRESQGPSSDSPSSGKKQKTWTRSAEAGQAARLEDVLLFDVNVNVGIQYLLGRCVGWVSRVQNTSEEVLGNHFEGRKTRYTLTREDSSGT